MRRITELLAREGIPFEVNCPMAVRSSFRIGGIAALGIFPQTREQAVSVLTLLGKLGVRHTVVGRGSNLLFPDGAWQGVLVFTEGLKKIAVNGCEITAEAGVRLSSLARCAEQSSLTGAEFAAGIPGTLGGAIVMNAGAYGDSMEGITVSTDYWNPETGRCERILGAEHAFGYRKSFFTEHPACTVLSSTLRFSLGDPAEIRARTEELQARRKTTQPLTLPSAGSVFKRPEGYFAGKLIEDCGLKGTQIGGAEVSQKHAGFIVNRGGATAEDVKRLIKLIQERVRAAFGVDLECELRFLE